MTFRCFICSFKKIRIWLGIGLRYSLPSLLVQFHASWTALIFIYCVSWCKIMQLIGFCTFEVRKSVHHNTKQIIQPKRCNNLTSLLLDFYVCLNMFRASPRPPSGAYNCTTSLWFSPVGEWQLERYWSWSGRCQTTTNNAPAASLQR